MNNKQVVIELRISTDLKTLDTLFNEDGTDEEFEEWVQDDLDEMSVYRILDKLHQLRETTNAEVTYVDIEDMEVERWTN